MALHRQLPPLRSHAGQLPTRLEAVDEVIDHLTLAGVVRELVADDASGQLDGKLTHLLPKLNHEQLPLGLELRLRIRLDAGRRLLGLLAHLDDDLLPLDPGFLTDARGIGAVSASACLYSASAASSRSLAALLSSICDRISSCRLVMAFETTGTTFL